VSERYLLDTDVVSALAKRRGDETLRAWMRAKPMEALHLSEVTIGEIAKGIARVNEAARRDALLSWLDNELLPSFEDRIVAIDRATWRLWGRLTGEAMRAGKPVPAIVALVAASAIRNDLVVVTGNARDFRRLGAALADPWAGARR